MTTIPNKISVNAVSVKNGFIIGSVLLVLLVVLRFIDPLIQFTSPYLSILIVVIIIALDVVLGLDVRKKIGGYWSFGQAFKSLFIATIIFVIISTLYNFVIFKYADPELPSKVSSVMLDKTTKMLEECGC